MTFLVDRNELPAGEVSYHWRTTVDERTVIQPEVPVIGQIRSLPPDLFTSVDQPTASAPASDGADAAAETLDAFYEQLSTSISSGDLEFAIQRLDPTVNEAYPTECQGTLKRAVDPEFSIMLVEEGDTGPWTWELPDDRRFEIPAATTATIVLSGRGQTGAETDAHVTLIDGEYHWFTFCPKE